MVSAAGTVPPGLGSTHRVAPVKIEAVAKVVMRGCSRTTATMRPLTRPQARPVARAARIPRGSRPS